MAGNAPDDQQWQAIEGRHRALDGAFFFAVRTTGVYCKPSCAGRPLRRNVIVFDHPEAAESAGFRACKRCKPLG
jgi:AraC family transcriptional regulator of adaptative response/methylated-DNA-[protein]-cysteine methyltransferase